MASNSPLPLCVDLDGSLLHTDSLWEACLRLVLNKPYMLPLMVLWLLKGKAGFKHQLSQNVGLPAQALPYNQALIDYIQSQKQQGRKVILVTASTRQIADDVAAHTGLFDEVMASSEPINLSGKRKAAALVEKFGEKGFVYAANAPVDMAVWQHAAAAILVNASAHLERRVGSQFEVEQVIPKPASRPMLLTILKAMRVHQWVKNLLLFVPLLLAHNWDQLDQLMTVGIAFLAFGFAASAIYLINDLIDLEADRAHTQKKHRPLAAGTLPIPTGIALALLLLLASLAIAVTINIDFLAVLITYLILTTAYSFYLKPVILLDVMTLTTLYTLRIIAGAMAISVPLSHWLLTFSMFIFLSLALSKRFSELHNLKQGESEKQHARGYHVDDLPVISLFGISSGYISVMVLVLYISDLQADALYNSPNWLWFVAIAVLYWISRIWLLANRGELHEDPVLFAIHDKVSYVVSLVVAASLLLAL